jgi:hypothetical protein
VTFVKARQILLLGVGTAAFAVAIWPPDLEPEYLALAATCFGLEPLAQGEAEAKGSK